MNEYLQITNDMAYARNINATLKSVSMYMLTNLLTLHSVHAKQVIDYLMSIQGENINFGFTVRPALVLYGGKLRDCSGLATLL